MNDVHFAAFVYLSGLACFRSAADRDEFVADNDETFAIEASQVDPKEARQIIEALADAIDMEATLTPKPEPVEVGKTVRWGQGGLPRYHVLAIDGDEAWVRCINSGVTRIARLADLKVAV